jgi:hypothetical protein
VKNQYFGDINDYRKYGLLRTLIGEKKDLTLGVCRMLTPNDSSRHGGKTDYLDDDATWKEYDCDLFKVLYNWVKVQDRRCVEMIEQDKAILPAKYHNCFVPETREKREAYFESMLRSSLGVDLVFFDPDNGLEVRSKPYNERPSCKHLYFSEVKKTFKAGHSVLVYQHFPRVDRAIYRKSRLKDIQDHTGAGPKQLWWLSTAHVLFLFATQEKHTEILAQRTQQFRNEWSEQEITTGRLQGQL